LKIQDVDNVFDLASISLPHAGIKWGGFVERIEAKRIVNLFDLVRVNDRKTCNEPNLRSVMLNGGCPPVDCMCI